jgi:hypothetical protein
MQIPIILLAEDEDKEDIDIWEEKPDEDINDWLPNKDIEEPESDKDIEDWLKDETIEPITDDVYSDTLTEDMLDELENDTLPDITVSHSPKEDIESLYDNLSTISEKSHFVNIYNNKNSTDIYTVSGTDKPMFVTWNFVSNNPAREIPQSFQKEFFENRESFQELDNSLIQEILKLNNFYGDRHKESGVELQNLGNYIAIDSGVNLALNYKVLGWFKEDTSTENMESLINYIGVSLAHESYHRYSMDEMVDSGGSRSDIEAAAYAFQTVFDPFEPIQNKYTEDAIDKIVEYSKDKSPIKSEYTAYWYGGRLFVADQLTEINPEYKELLEKDIDPFKSNALKQFPNYIDLEGLNYLRTKTLTTLIDHPETFKSNLANTFSKYNINLDKL